MTEILVCPGLRYGCQSRIGALGQLKPGLAAEHKQSMIDFAPGAPLDSSQ